MESRDRRASERKKQHADVCLAVDDKSFEGSTQLHNISLDGMLVRSEEKVTENSNCRWELTLTGPSSKLIISGKGRIVRQDSRGVAIKFTEMEMDSYTYLKTVVFGDTAPDIH